MLAILSVLWHTIPSYERQDERDSRGNRPDAYGHGIGRGCVDMGWPLGRPQQGRRHGQHQAAYQGAEGYPDSLAQGP